MNEEELDIYFIPSNYEKKIRKFDFNERKFAETIVFTGIIVVSICMIPFVLQLKAILAAVFGLASTLIFSIGIKGESVLQYAASFFRYKKDRKCYVFELPRNIREKNKKIGRKSE